MASSRNRPGEHQDNAERRPQNRRLAAGVSAPAPGADALATPLVETLGSGFSEATVQRHAALLGDPRLSHPANARQKAQIMQRLQRDYGNQYVLRLVERVRGTRAGGVVGVVSPLVQRQPEAGGQGGSGPLTEDQVAAARRWYRQRRGRYPEEVALQIQGKVGTATDGTIGPLTIQAVAEWQSRNGLAVDGKAGPGTLTAMFGTDIRPGGGAAPQAQEEAQGAPESEVPGAVESISEAEALAIAEGAEAPAAAGETQEKPELTQEEKTEDEIISKTILGLLKDFENIEIQWTEPQPEGVIGPPRGFSVNVRAVYFINTETSRQNFGTARQQERFNDIIRGLRGETSVMVGGRGGALSAGETVLYGKATPADIKKFVEKAVELGVITSYARNAGQLKRTQELVDLPQAQVKKIIQGWINKTRVGVDCSGLVAQAALQTQKAVGAAQGVAESELPSTARVRKAASFANGAQVRQPTDLRPGHAWVVSGGGHVLIVAQVERKEGHVQFVTVESAGDSGGGSGPTRREWRTKSLEEFHRITLVSGPRANSRGGSFHEIP